MSTVGKLEIGNIWNLSQTPERQDDETNKLQLVQSTKTGNKTAGMSTDPRTKVTKVTKVKTKLNWKRGNKEQKFSVMQICLISFSAKIKSILSTVLHGHIVMMYSPAVGDVQKWICTPTCNYAELDSRRSWKLNGQPCFQWRGVHS